MNAFTPPAAARAPRVMGILNVTPDSFSDGGRFLDAARAAEAAEQMAADGADVIDVGGESTRPGADPVDAETELRRLLPVLARLRGRLSVPLSIDTSKFEVARVALREGASILNDVTGFSDPRMVRLAADSGATVVVMHMRGSPRSMQESPAYADVVGEVSAFLTERALRLADAGVARERIWLDPGIGFGKTLAHNLELLRNAATLARLGFPLLVGPSRKSFIGTLTGAPVAERLAGTLAAVAWLAAQGVGAVRVHDVRETVHCLKVLRAVMWGAEIP